MVLIISYLSTSLGFSVPSEDKIEEFDFQAVQPQPINRKVSFSKVIPSKNYP